MPTIIPQASNTDRLGTVPVEENNYDCGLFTLQYIEEIVTKQHLTVDAKKKSLSIENMLGVEKSRSEQETVERKRGHICKLIRLLSHAIESGQLQAPFNSEDLIKLYEEAKT
ncbi:hypothetical protein KFL_007380110 [Klebsormidium nitens]|uniref:Ubiquitin-like protease family profile domain-containing protein n=1 Tax=Klebsormidium nitens TaxID=105231 RepID=A0A1Y1IQZ3_KLENI|nr:hypothetical protein KFL_007380110 [Klebsormidium nitens]|eukprot:GAQ91176.1 hypothetical protein KFL_007380110 [Klebsormidium nitens]